MISICIPIYNYYSYPLVRRLATQIEKSASSDGFEIVCIDDHSTGFSLNQNKGISEIATYIRLEKNIGRAQIRNLFLKHTHGEWLIFLDNDSLVGGDFLKNYAKAAGSDAAVIVGGRIYDNRGDDKTHRLRYLYGTRIESRPVEWRRQHPYQSFMTNNFMIRREVLEKIPFDSRLSSYGHEDTLFGYRLEEHRVPILHIDNPVTNGYVETNVEFLHKTVEAVENLVKIHDFMWEDQRFCQSVRLLRSYYRVRQLGLHRPLHCIFQMTKPLLETHFASGTAITMTQFSFYKLGLFIDKKHYDNKL